jgi:hypothetical protein
MMPGYKWSMKGIAPNQFAVAFPSVELLRFCSCSTTLTLPLNQIQVSTEPSTAHPHTVATLSTVWVRVLGFPNEVEVRTNRGIELVAQAIGKLVEVEMVSLTEIGPVHLRVMCPNPEMLPAPCPRSSLERLAGPSPSSLTWITCVLRHPPMTRHQTGTWKRMRILRGDDASGDDEAGLPGWPIFRFSNGQREV